MQILRAMAEALFRQRAVFWVLSLGALAIAGAASLLVPPAWRSSALVAAPQDFADPAGIGLLASTDLHRQVVARIGADQLYPGLDPEAAVDAFGRHLRASHRRENTFEVTYDGRTSALAVAALQAALSLMAEQNAHLQAAARDATLDRQAEILKGIRDAARQQLDAYRQENNLDGVADRRQQLLQQKAEMATQLKQTVNTQADLTARMRALRGQMDQLPTATDAPPPPDDSSSREKVIDEAKGRLLELQLKEQELLSKYTETSQFVVTVRHEIAQVKAFLGEMAPATGHHDKRTANDAYVELSRRMVNAENQMAGVTERRAALETQLAEVDQRLGDMDDSDQDLHRLERAAAEAEGNLGRFEEARRNHAAEADRSRGMTIIAQPTAPSRPLRPDPTLYFGLAAGFGLLLGLGGAVLAQLLSATFGTPSDVERRLGLPVLAALPIKS